METASPKMAGKAEWKDVGFRDFKEDMVKINGESAHGIDVKVHNGQARIESEDKTSGSAVLAVPMQPGSRYELNFRTHCEAGGDENR